MLLVVVVFVGSRFDMLYNHVLLLTCSSTHTQHTGRNTPHRCQNTRTQKLAQNIRSPHHLWLPTLRNSMSPPLEQSPQTHPRQRTMDRRRRCHSGTSRCRTGCKEVECDCAAFAGQDWEAVSGTVAQSFESEY